MPSPAGQLMMTVRAATGVRETEDRPDLMTQHISCSTSAFPSTTHRFHRLRPVTCRFGRLRYGFSMISFSLHH